MSAKEWKVLKDQEIWGVRFITLEDAEDYIRGLIDSGHSNDFKIKEMTKGEINQYCGMKL